MGEIVSFPDKSKYQNELKEIIEFLENINDELRHKMFVLATLDKWKEWSDKQPAGTSVEFTEEMLQSTGDKNINALLALKEKISTIKEEITKG